MKTNIVSVEHLNEPVIPQGKYSGIFSGYRIDINDKWRIHTRHGIRGINMPVTVTIKKDGSMDVLPKRNHENKNRRTLRGPKPGLAG